MSTFNKVFILLLLVLVPFFVDSQDSHRKGEIYANWGWNRSMFTNSTIRFTGDNYDFTLHDVVASDRQEKFDFDTYFNPVTLTIPQYNFRIGYYLNDKYDISIGTDHMKYVVVTDQKVKMTGNISGTSYDGTYNHPVIIDEDFLHFEHSDGLNYVNVEIRRSAPVFTGKYFRIETRTGLGIGALVPRSNITLMDNERYDQFHLAGYGFSLVGGIHFSFFNHFFIQFNTKGGFIHMPDIRTTQYKSDRASQHFLFGQINGVFGFNFNTN